MDFLSCIPTVFVVEDHYQILINAHHNGIFAIEIAGSLFYEENNGTLSSQKNFAKISVPRSLLDQEKSYTVIFRKTITRKAYFSQLENAKYSTFEFKPLTKKEKVTYEDLEEYIEVCYPDPYVPYMPLSDVKKIELPSNIQKRIYIYERSSALNLLENLPMSFMWTSPAIPELLERYNLVVLDCEDNNNYFQDVLICKKNYTFTEIDNRFLKSLKEMEKEVINELD